MSLILKEQEVTLETLASHLEEAGWDVDLQKSSIALHTSRGLGFSIRLDMDRPFIIFYTVLPLSHNFDGALELVNRLNSEVFLAGFHLDEDGDLRVNYVMSFERRLMLAQMMRITRRFGGLIEHVVSTFDKDERIFDFRRSAIDDIDEHPHVLQ